MNSVVDRFESDGGYPDYPKDRSRGYEYIDKFFTFHEYLYDEFAKLYIGDDDDFESALDRWIEDLDCEKMIDYATDYGMILFKKGKNL